MRRYAVVGTGHRAEMYVRAMVSTHADVAVPVAWCDPNPQRMAYYDDLVQSERPSVALPARYAPEQLATLLRTEHPDAVVVTSPDWSHAEHVEQALDHGCDVIVEKPLTTDLAGAKSIAAAAQAAAGHGARLVVTFNYRYSPRNRVVRELIADGAVGEVTSVNFEWLLDTVHGADYFRRWHRDKASSGGLLVHKASHHFDLVNWWLDDLPATVFATGGLRFYGADNAERRGIGPRAQRGTGAIDDPFALDLTADDRLRRLYLEAEQHDGYLRDRDVFTEGISIEDNLSVVVRYAGGAGLAYSLNAHAPWEGYRVAINGTAGRIELDVVERPQVSGPRSVLDPSAVVVSATRDPVRHKGNRLLLQRHWQPAELIPIPEGVGSHGGGDARLLDDIFRGDTADPLGLRAGYVDGLRSVAVGIAANASIATGQAVEIESLGLPLSHGRG